MGYTGRSRRTLQRAKRHLLDKYGDRDWFCGIGIVPTAEGLGLRLNVDPDVPVEPGEIPQSYRRISIEIVPMKGYTAR